MMSKWRKHISKHINISKSFQESAQNHPSVMPTSFRNHTEINPTSSWIHPEINSKSSRNNFKITPKSHGNRPHIITTLFRNHSTTILESSKIRPQIIPTSFKIMSKSSRTRNHPNNILKLFRSHQCICMSLMKWETRVGGNPLLDVDTVVDRVAPRSKP